MVVGDAVEPGGKGGIPTERTPRAVGFQKDFLGRVFGFCLVFQERVAERINFSLVGFDGLDEIFIVDRVPLIIDD